MFLYDQIAESIRQEISGASLQPGDRLPSVRDMAAKWQCTIGTVQRAYEELARQGLVVSRHGQGTRVVKMTSVEETVPLRRATLVHRAEAFLLEVLTAGYSEAEVEQSLRLALDRWRALTQQPIEPPEHQLRFVGSHDPAVAWIAAHFSEIVPGYTSQLTFAGSLGGLMALASGEADLAGCHLWDEESDTYNVPFVRRLLFGQRVALLTLAHRRLGFMTVPSLSSGLTHLRDLAAAQLRFVNRQRGAGTRIWLDAHLQRLNIAPERIPGYERELRTHSEVAQAIAEGQADVGLGVEATALAFGLNFIPLTQERYDFVVPLSSWEKPSVQALAQWLGTAQAKRSIKTLGGYDLIETGQVRWVG